MSALPAELYMFEDVVEKAGKLWLEENGVNDVKKQQDDEVEVDGRKVTLKTPRVELQFRSAGLSREHYYVNQATGARWLDLSDGILVLQIITRRGASDQSSHAYLRGLCRYLMQFASSISGKMQYHVIEKIGPEGQGTPTTVVGKNHDASAIQFPITLRILGAAFPTS